MDSRPSLGLAAALSLALAVPASAHVLSADEARQQAEDVASFVAGVLTADYRVKDYGVRSCEQRSEHKVVCTGYWKLVDRGDRSRWSCTANLIVRLVDDDFDLDYNRLRCRRRR